MHPLKPRILDGNLVTEYRVVGRYNRFRHWLRVRGTLQSTARRMNAWLVSQAAPPAFVSAPLLFFPRRVPCEVLAHADLHVSVVMEAKGPPSTSSPKYSALVQSTAESWKNKRTSVLAHDIVICPAVTFRFRRFSCSQDGDATFGVTHFIISFPRARGGGGHMWLCRFLAYLGGTNAAKPKCRRLCHICLVIDYIVRK